jgi:MFS family permease
MAGFGDKSDAIFQMLIVHGGLIFFTLLAIWLVDRIGRRPLWLITSAAMIFSLVLAGMIFHFNVRGIPVLLVIFMCAWPHCVGLGALPWLIMSEIHPTRIRAKAVAISTTFLWIAAFITAMFFPMLATLSEKKLGSIIGVFLMYAVICVFALIFGWRMLPETKNRTLEEIAASWLKRK